MSDSLTLETRTAIAKAFYQAGKAPLVAAFEPFLKNLADLQMLRCKRPKLAACRFIKLTQASVISPHVAAVG